MLAAATTVTSYGIVTNCSSAASARAGINLRPHISAEKRIVRQACPRIVIG